MADLIRDPIMNAINKGIRCRIEATAASGCYGSVVVLVYSGMDSMASLAMPANQTQVMGKDFIDWADHYIKFPCKEQLTGADLYGARCAMLHTYSVYSKISREGKCRIIGYMDEAVPEVAYQPAIDKELVLVSVPALARAFFRGIDAFLIDVFSDESRAQTVEARLENLLLTLPASDSRV